MRNLKTALIVVAILSTTALAAAPRKIFEITFNELPGMGLGCDIAFFGDPPPPATVDKIVRSALEAAVLVDPSHDILATAFAGDDAMTKSQYSGSLVYKTADKKIMTFDESRGIKAAGKDAGAYYVETKEDKTFEGIKPERHWLDVTLVFPRAPTIKQAYDAAVEEAEKVSKRGMDAHVYVDTGDKATPTSWKQLRDPDGGFVFVDYQASSKTIKKKTKVLKQLQ
jgi:hypothetical protein